VKELLSLPPSQRSHVLLTMPLHLEEKRNLREAARAPAGTPAPLLSPPSSPQGCRGLWYRLLSLLRAARPWHYALKQIGGRFGSSVLSYFLFLKTLLMLNFLSFFILLAFVVVPQAVHPPASVSPLPFTGLELLTGGGHFTHSLLYYGYYSNITLNDPCGSSPKGSVCPLAHPPLPYNLPLAYLFSIGVSFLVTCILLVYSVSRSFRESVRSSTEELAIKVFCTWDFKVIQRRSVKLQCENICTQLKVEELSNAKHPRPQPCALSITPLGPAARTEPCSGPRVEAVLLVLPLVVSLLNALMPYLFNFLAMWEKQDSPVTQVYVAIVRWAGWGCGGGSPLHLWQAGRLWGQCWETCVGQDLYRFMVMDFIFTLLDTLFGELIWRLILEKKVKTKRRPEFDVARNVLELIYGQTLTWLGILYAPLLPAVQILKLLLLFYIKKTSLMRNCQSPSKPWQASRMSTIFITLLCFPSFLGAAAFLSYTIWTAHPSETCGPFRGLETIYESGKRWVLVLEKSNPNITWFAWVYQNLLENTSLLFFMSVALIAVIYFNIQVVRGRQRVICLLQEQIANEGEDKAFLIQKLHSVCRHKYRRS
uniref:Transmembrane channel-like protein n=1 Tax=Zosterops lateralis melanops TaxID=1220523 RepID=A0A8D2QTF1_ZOSLA